MDSLTPKSHAEAVAVFRHGVIGALTQAQMDRGQLRDALRALSAQRFVPPRSKTARCFSVTTLERWYYAFRKRGLPGLSPQPRSDKGRAKQLSAEQLELLLAIESLREPGHLEGSDWSAKRGRNFRLKNWYSYVNYFTAQKGFGVSDQSWLCEDVLMPAGDVACPKEDLAL